MILIFKKSLQTSKSAYKHPNGMQSGVLIVFILISLLSILSIITSFFMLVHGQNMTTATITNSSTSDNNNNTLTKLTDKGSLIVILKPLTESIKMHPEALLFTITFVKPSTGEVQKHVDFDLIMTYENKPIYQVSNHTGQMGNIPLHTIDGFVDIPILTNKIPGPGVYSVKIPIYGILFNPIRPETAQFDIRITS